MKMEENMEKMKDDAFAVAESSDIEDGPRLVSLRRPFVFEGKTYHRIDLSGLDDITAKDMMDVNRRLTRQGNIDFSQETTLEYALTLAQVATGLPMEFFVQLPPYVAMQIKNRVAGFLYRQE